MYSMNDNVNHKNMKECRLFSASFYGHDVKVTDHFSCLEGICACFLFSEGRIIEYAVVLATFKGVIIFWMVGGEGGLENTGGYT